MKQIIFIAALISLIALISNMAHEDDVAQQEHYCEMVKTKSWPDYKGIYKKHCPQ